MKKEQKGAYYLILILFFLQVASSSYFLYEISLIDDKIKISNSQVENKMIRIIDSYDRQYTQNFNEITSTLISQQTDINEQIRNIESSGRDFSEVISEAVKGVVGISTDLSIGSGFIITSDGYIVTNEHVIENSTKITVVTYDNMIYNAEVIGEDKLRDVALLKIPDAKEWLNFDDSDSVDVGNKVIAIGNPLGLSFTVTEGIVSALDREGINGLNEYIQTDVSLNPGNSGGPLINKEGKVIGINNFKVGDAESIGFALESNSVIKAINKLANQTIV